MTDGLDIENLLQAGYFKTTRAKSGQPTSPLGSPREGGVVIPQPASENRDEHLKKLVWRGNLPRKPRPPPPTVEDEADSLAREHGSTIASTPEAEEPLSKGDLEQYPIIMEVHEHNPERRFVLVENTQNTQNSSPSDTAEEAKLPSDRGQDKRPKTPTSSRPPTPNGATTPKTRSPSRHPGSVIQESSSTSRRRKSKPDLPPVDTTWEEDKTPSHHRAASVTASRPPESFYPKSSRQFGESLLSPEIVQHGARRDRIIANHGQTQRVPEGDGSKRSKSNLPEDRKRDTGYSRRSPSPGPGKRSSSHTEPAGPRQPSSSTSRYRDEKSATSRDRIRDSITRNGDERAKVDASMQQPPREASRPGEEKSPVAPAPRPRRPKSIVEQEEGREAPTIAPADRPEEISSTKRNTTPRPPSPRKAGGSIGDNTPPLRGSATFSINTDDRKARNRQETFLPYPDGNREPQSARPRTPTKSANWPELSRPKAVPNGSRPLPSVPSTSTARPVEGSAVASAATLSPNSVKTEEPPHWRPPPFDPEKDGVRADVPIGAYRRFSEGKDNTGPPSFPACPRVKPATGKMDWLTLPRTDFNICPTCYNEVFSQTAYRNEFQPMLRPTDRPIACDFGTSAWYRIAWLMTWHNKSPDLHLLHQIANIASASKEESCPGNKKSTRKWYTIWNPTDRKPIQEFPVCYQCAKTAEALLPSLSGIFSPLEPRSESSSWRTCELHFAPERKRFVLYFDLLERASQKATTPIQKTHIAELAKDLEKLSLVSECREDSPIPDGHWHVMQFLPQFTVCGDCFEDVVRPKLDGRNVVACNFFNKQKQLPLATCQLYSPRMREIFTKACRRSDPAYLEEKVKERLRVEAEIHAELVKLDRPGQDDAWVEKQVAELIQEWKRWE